MNSSSTLFNPNPFAIFSFTGTDKIVHFFNFPCFSISYWSAIFKY